MRTVPILWFENEAGERWYPPRDCDGLPDTPEGFRYQWFRNPFELHDSCCTTEGRLMGGTSSWPPDLVLALTRPSWREWLVSTLRYGTPARRVAFDMAIVRAAGCEGCINRLAHRVGLSWGYRKGSAKDVSGTNCEHCDAEPK